MSPSALEARNSCPRDTQSPKTKPETRGSLHVQPSPRLGTNSSAAAGGLEPFLQGGVFGDEGAWDDDLNLRGTCTRRRRRRCELRTVELAVLRRLQRRLAACLGAHFGQSALDFTGLPTSCTLWLW